MKRILVATDLSERSDRAVDRAILLARRFRAALTVIHVIDEDLPAPVADNQQQAAKASLRDHLSSIPGTKDIKITMAVDFGKDWTGILRQADAEKSDLIILGLHRETGLEGLFRGTTVERVVRNGNAPVLVVRNRAARDYGKVVVGIDFSVYSQRAVDFAAGFAPDARTYLVHAFDIPFRSYLAASDPQAEISKRHGAQITGMIDQEMTHFLAGLQAKPPKMQTVLREGEPQEVIRGQVSELGAELLILGTHGRTGVAHALLGSVAEGFLTDPPCDVVAVKAW